MATRTKTRLCNMMESTLSTLALLQEHIHQRTVHLGHHLSSLQCKETRLSLLSTNLSMTRLMSRGSSSRRKNDLIYSLKYINNIILYSLFLSAMFRKWKQFLPHAFLKRVTWDCVLIDLSHVVWLLPSLRRECNIYCKFQHVIYHAGDIFLKDFWRFFKTRICVYFYEPGIIVSVNYEVVTE